MNIRKLFCDIAAGKRNIEITDDEPDELAELKARMFSGKWDDVEYYGPGPAEANARRAAALARDAKPAEGTTNEPPAVSHKPEKKSRRRMTKRERLEAKAAALRAEIEALKNENTRQ